MIPHTIVFPETESGLEGNLFIEIVRAALLAQELFAVTEMFPFVNVDAKFTIKFVPLVTIGDVPAVDVTPAGKVHVYEVALTEVAVV